MSTNGIAVYPRLLLWIPLGNHHHDRRETQQSVHVLVLDRETHLIERDRHLLCFVCPCSGTQSLLERDLDSLETLVHFI